MSIPVREYIGMTEEQLRNKNIKYQVYKRDGRYSAITLDDGTVKVILEKGVVITAFLKLKEDMNGKTL